MRYQKIGQVTWYVFLTLWIMSRSTASPQLSEEDEDANEDEESGEIEIDETTEEYLDTETCTIDDLFHIHRYKAPQHKSNKGSQHKSNKGSHHKSSSSKQSSSSCGQTNRNQNRFCTKNGGQPPKSSGAPPTVPSRVFFGKPGLTPWKIYMPLSPASNMGGGMPGGSTGMGSGSMGSGGGMGTQKQMGGNGQPPNMTSMDHCSGAIISPMCIVTTASCFQMAMLRQSTGTVMPINQTINLGVINRKFGYVPPMYLSNMVSTLIT